MEFHKLVTATEVSQHNHLSDCWIVIDDAVWDVTAFAPQHPGGDALLLKYAGRDATRAYAEYHSPSLVRSSLPLDCFKGNLDRSTITRSWKDEREVKEQRQRPPLHDVINLHDFEQAAAQLASPKTFAFYSTAATDCWTRDMNQTMYKRMWFRPRVMRDVAEIDTSTSILGIPVRMPLFICPTGLARMINPDGEKALARAAKSSGILEIVSSLDNDSLRTDQDPDLDCRQPSAPGDPGRSARVSVSVSALRQQGPQEDCTGHNAGRSSRCQGHIRHC
jgi:L-lactate dehydrogenase (cytochrome)